MDEPLTRTQAHKLFGELYNKPRPPELQKQVDEIVNRYSDIYVRIKKIHELDQKYQEQQKKELPKDNSSNSRQTNKNQITIRDSSPMGQTNRYTHPWNVWSKYSIVS
jgi:hypothetical protein